VSDIAVVIPCHNAVGVLGRQLAALARQHPRHEWSVVSGDDGAEDDLPALVQRHRHDLPQVRIVRLDRRSGTGTARNAGARATSAATLLFLDADDEVADGYLDAMAAALERSAVVTAGIDYTRLNPPEVLRRTPADQLCDVLSGGLFLPHVLGGLMGMDRALFDRLGGFDGRFPALADLDISWRAQLAGHDIAIADTTVSVSVRSTDRARLRRGRFQGRDIVELRDAFARHGVEPLGWSTHAAGWAALAALAVRTPSAAGRAAFMWELGWQLGEFGGLLDRRRRPAADARPQAAPPPVSRPATPRPATPQPKTPRPTQEAR
jgi:glycosyltransferase involved in cell wall biosynthesis